MSKKIEINSCEYIWKVPSVLFDKNKASLDEMKKSYTTYPCKTEIDENEKYCQNHKQKLCKHKLIQETFIDFDYDNERYYIYDVDLLENYHYICEICDFDDFKEQKYGKRINLEDLRNFLWENLNEFEILKFKIDKWLEEN